MLINNQTLDGIINGEISVLFRFWKRPTVKGGGSLKTRKGVVLIKELEITNPADVSDKDLINAGLKSREEISAESRDGDFYLIRVAYGGADPRIAMRENLDPAELARICAKLNRMGTWTRAYLQLIEQFPNTPAQMLADLVELEKMSFKVRVRRMKALGLTESLRPGYRLSQRGEKILELLNSGS
jgi:hypothetical protein